MQLMRQAQAMRSGLLSRMLMFGVKAGRSDGDMVRTALGNAASGLCVEDMEKFL